MDRYQVLGAVGGMILALIGAIVISLYQKYRGK